MAVIARADTVAVRAVGRAPAADRLADSTGWGLPQISLKTGQGTASIWLLRAGDSVYLVAAIPDSTFYWGDDLVVSLDTEGDRAETPQHDDFQWYFRRVLDSSVVYRGRAGQWGEPQGDPDWRLGQGRSGAGWDVRASERSGGRGWTVVLRLDAGWFGLGRGTTPGLAIRIYDDAPGGWHAWPEPPPGTPPARVERRPALWSSVRPSASAASSGAAPPGGP
ncbi:MAG: hypothetical protein ACREOC_02220 [Gemmatimonadales bacterium]